MIQNYKDNHHNHNVFNARENSASVSRENQRMFQRLQNIHTVSKLAISNNTLAKRLFIEDLIETDKILLFLVEKEMVDRQVQGCALVPGRHYYGFESDEPRDAQSTFQEARGC